MGIEDEISVKNVDEGNVIIVEEANNVDEGNVIIEEEANNVDEGSVIIVEEANNVDSRDIIEEDVNGKVDSKRGMDEIVEDSKNDDIIIEVSVNNVVMGIVDIIKGLGKQIFSSPLKV